MNNIKEYKILEKIRKLTFQNYLKESGRYGIGAIITDKKGRIISVNFNSYTKTHPKQLFFNNINTHRIYLHAEIGCLIKCKQEPYMMIIVRVNKYGGMTMAKPCEGCLSAIKNSKLKKVYYTNYKGELVLLNLYK